MKLLPIEEQENGKLKLLSEEETDLHVEGLLSCHRDIETQKYKSLDDVLFHYFLKHKETAVVTSTFIY
jgi:hypothetical protein